MHVVHRVEAPPGQEGQIAAVPGEDRILVLEAPVGDVDDRTVGDPGHLDLPQGAADARMRPGQPRAVRRERQVPHRPVGGADQLRHLSGPGAFGPGGVRGLLRGVEQQQPPVVRGDRDPLALRVRHQLMDAAQLAGGQPPRFPVPARPRQIRDFDGVGSVRVRDIGDLARAAEHLRHPYPYAGGVRDRAGGTVAVGEPVQAAAYVDGAGPSRLVDGDRVDVTGGRHLVAAASGARAAEPYLQLAGHGARGRQIVDDPQFARALVDDSATVARGVPRIEGVMVGVAQEAGSVGQTGVEVADAFVVGEESDPPRDEHRAVQMAVEVGEQPLAVQPQPARRSAPVPLPGGRFVRRLAGEEQRAVFSVDVRDLDVGDRPPGQPPAGEAVGGHLVGPGEVGEGLAVRGNGQDVAVRVPAADPGVGGAPVGQPPGRSSVDRGEMDLGVEAAPVRVRDMAAVRGEARMADSGPVDGDPPGPSRSVALRHQGRDPEIVLGGEAQQVVVQMRETEIRDVVTHPQCFRCLVGAATRGAW